MQAMSQCVYIFISSVFPHIKQLSVIMCFRQQRVVREHQESGTPSALCSLVLLVTDSFGHLFSHLFIVYITCHLCNRD